MHKLTKTPLNCCLCPSEHHSRRFKKKDSYTYRKCHHCGLVFLDTDTLPQHSFYEDSLETIHHNSSRHAIEYWSIPQYFLKYQELFNHFFSERLDQLRSAGYQDGKLLDIGCGYGFFVHYCAEQGIEAEGLDTAAAQVEWAQQEWNLPIVQSSLEDFQPHHQYDAIVLADVLEHFWDPLKILQKIHTLMPTNGILAIQVPNLLGLKLPWGHRWGVPHHLWQFNHKTLRKLIERAGFAEVSASTGVLGITGMHERGGPTIMEHISIWLARKTNLGNRLLLICTKK